MGSVKRRGRKGRNMAAALALLLAACSGKAPESPGRTGAGEYQAGNVPAPGGAEKGVTIGFSVATDTFIMERWNKDMKVFSAAAQELGAAVIVQLSAGGSREQIAQINYLVNQRIDMLVLIAHDTELLSEAVKQIRDAGVPVIAYDRMIMGVPLDAYISFDSREVGRMFGAALLKAVPRGNYLVVNGSVHDANSYEINGGLHETIDPVAGRGEISVVREIWLEEWSFDEALEKIGEVFEETLDRDVRIDAISCGNDQIAGAAVQLLAERRLAGSVVVVGQDAELINCQYIMEGVQLMTAYKPIGRLGVRAARLAMAIAEKKSLPPDMLLDNGSGVSVPSYIEKPIAVYKANMDVVIKDGFHSYEDIYRTVLDTTGP
ncbi:MAG: substrate-binding domain-containing protein [Spirochaetaceae bacterium]|jgi:D-xylose transport system substrate-binding protein|nr:substrate-binding domain-containing protein [Spirochaetaceae bacterium]